MLLEWNFTARATRALKEGTQVYSVECTPMVDAFEGKTRIDRVPLKEKYRVDLRAKDEDDLAGQIFDWFRPIAQFIQDDIQEDFEGVYKIEINKVIANIRLNYEKEEG